MDSLPHIPPKPVKRYRYRYLFPPVAWPVLLGNAALVSLPFIPGLAEGMTRYVWIAYSIILLIFLSLITLTLLAFWGNNYAAPRWLVLDETGFICPLRPWGRKTITIPYTALRGINEAKIHNQHFLTLTYWDNARDRLKSVDIDLNMLSASDKPSLMPALAAHIQDQKNSISKSL